MRTNLSSEIISPKPVPPVSVRDIIPLSSGGSCSSCGGCGGCGGEIWVDWKSVTSNSAT